jgi:periplasmic protein TonB
MNALANLHAPEPITQARRYATGSLIALAHLIAFHLIMINPPQFLRSAPKETVMLMITSQTPPAAAPLPKLLKTIPPSTPEHNIAPVLTTSSENHAAIQQTPVAVEPATVAAAPVSYTPVVASTPQEVNLPKVVSAIEYLQAPQQEYPAMAKRMGEEGRVEMQVLVNGKRPCGKSRHH